MSADETTDVFAEVSDLLEQRRGFLAYDLAQAADLEGVDIAALLGATSGQHLRAAACRTPARDWRFAEQTKAIAQYADVATSALAFALRYVDALNVLRHLAHDHRDARSVPVTLAAAARDVFEDEATPDLPPAGVIAAPGWLEAALETFWAGDEPDAFPRDLELHALLHMPVAVVDIDDLSVKAIKTWLRERGVSGISEVTDRQLRACLVVGGGVGLLFVNASDSEEERRMSLAHELAHLLDYLKTRADVERVDPQLLDVLDGVREPTKDERIRATLSRLPLGLTTHLLERHSDGSYVDAESGLHEERADLLGWEILAPRRDVLRHAGRAEASVLVELLRTRYGMPIGPAREYARHLSSHDSHDWLGFDPRSSS